VLRKKKESLKFSARGNFVTARLGAHLHSNGRRAERGRTHAVLQIELPKDEHNFVRKIVFEHMSYSWWFLLYNLVAGMETLIIQLHGPHSKRIEVHSRLDNPTLNIPNPC
jgi:hypothetical protein